MSPFVLWKILLPLCSLQVPEFKRKPFDSAAHDGQRRKKLGVPVALYNLRGMWINGQAKNMQGRIFQPGCNKGIGTDRAGYLAHPHAFKRVSYAFAVPDEFGVKAGHFQAKACWFGMDAMSAAHAERSLIFFCQLPEAMQKFFQIFEDDFSGLLNQQGIGCIHNVA